MTATILLAGEGLYLRGSAAPELAALGYTVRCATTRDDVLAELGRDTVDVLVGDLRERGADPAGLLLETRDVYPDTELVALVDPADPGSVLRCVQAGGMELVPSDRGMAPLVAAVRRAADRQARRDESVLYRAASTLGGASSTEDLHRGIVEVGLLSVGADDGCLMLPTMEGRLYVAQALRAGPGARDDSFVALGERIAGKVALERRAAIINQPAEGTETDTQPPLPAGAQKALNGRMRSSMVVPVHHDDVLRGVMCFNRVLVDRPFTAADLRRANFLATLVHQALELNDLRSRLWGAEKYIIVGQMAAGVAHDINNPVSYVLSNVQYASQQLAQGGADTEDVRGALEDAQTGAIRIRDIVKDLHNLAYVDFAREASFPLDVAIQSAVRITGFTVKSRARVKLDLQDAVEVFGTVGALAQVFVSLLKNAADAMGPRTDGIIGITSRASGGEVTVEVTDNGPGIPEMHAQGVFRPFFTTKPAAKAAGLGLAMCQDIVRKHGGRIELASTPGLGTTVTVHLPVSAGAANSDVPRAAAG